MAENTIIKDFNTLSRKISSINLSDPKQADNFSKKLEQIKTIYYSEPSTDSTIIQLLVNLSFEIDKYMNDRNSDLTLHPEIPSHDSGTFKQRQAQQSNASSFVDDVYQNLSTCNLDIEKIKQFKIEMEHAKSNSNSYSEKTKILSFYNEIIAKLVLAYQMIYFLDNDKIPSLNISEFCDIDAYITVCLERLSNQMKENQSNIGTDVQHTIIDLSQKNDLQINELLSSDIFNILVLGESRLIDNHPNTNSTTNTKITKSPANNKVHSSKKVEVPPQSLVQYNCKTNLFQKGINFLKKLFPNIETVTLVYKKEHKNGSTSFYNRTYIINSQNFKLPFLSCRKKLSIVGCIFSDNITQFNEIDYKTNILPFSGCLNLEELHLPANLEAIPPFFFYSTSIKELVLPKQIRVIGRYAFANCNKLEKITNLNKTCIEEIHTGAFQECALTHLELPSTIRVLDDYAFGRNEKLTNVKIPMDSFLTLKNFWENYQNDHPNDKSLSPFRDCPRQIELAFVDDEKFETKLRISNFFDSDKNHGITKKISSISHNDTVPKDVDVGEPR